MKKKWKAKVNNMERIKLDHEASKINEAMGISSSRVIEIEEIVKNQKRSCRRISNIIEDIWNSDWNIIEKIYATLIFENLGDNSKSVLSLILKSIYKDILGDLQGPEIEKIIKKLKQGIKK